MPIFQLNINSEMDLIIVNSINVNEVSIWTSNEGELLYNISVESNNRIASGQEEFNGSSFTKDTADKSGASASKSQGLGAF